MSEERVTRPHWIERRAAEPSSGPRKRQSEHGETSYRYYEAPSLTYYTPLQKYLINLDTQVKEGQACADDMKDRDFASKG
jgi:hypothetical protein